MSILTVILLTVGFLLIIFPIELNALFKITKAECTLVEQNVLRIDYCRAKPVKRDITELTIRATLLQKVTAMTINVEILRKFNTYEPVGINGTGDFCAYLGQRRGGKHIDLFNNLVKNYWNINHSCPYEHSIAIEKFVPKLDNLFLPIPTGDYLFLSRWIFNKQFIGYVKVGFSFREKKIFEKRH